MKQIKDKIKGIIFDMDGTIIETELIWKNALERMLLGQGVTHDLGAPGSVGEKMIGKEMSESIELLRETFNITRENAELVTDTLAHARDLFQETIEFIPGFENFHNILIEAEMPVCIATNCDPDSLEHLKKKMDLPKFFGQHIYCLAHVENKAKPDPAVFLHAAAQMGVKPEECLVFEDSYYGFMAAKAAGMHCIAIKNNKNKDFFEEHTHGGISHYDEAIDLIIDLTGKINK